MICKYVYHTRISLLILATIGLAYTKTTSNTMESSGQSTKATNNTEIMGTSNESSWKPLHNNSQYAPQSVDKIYSIDLATFHKYRRNGIANNNRDDNDHRRNYYSLYPEQNHYDSEVYQYQQHERPRYQENVHPVQIQSCPHYMRDVNRFQYDHSANYNYGVLQGWLGGMLPTTNHWRGKPDEDRPYESTPSYITTATAKIPASFNRYQHNTDNSGNKYQRSGYDKSQVPVKSKQYDIDYRTPSTPHYNDFRNRDYDHEIHEQPGWSIPNQKHKNQRTIYYEYNLDGIRKPNDFRNQQGASNCGPHYGLPPCEQEVYINHRPTPTYPYNAEYGHNHFSGPFPSHSKSLLVDYEDNTATPDPEHIIEEPPQPYRFLRDQGDRRPGSGSG